MREFKSPDSRPRASFDHAPAETGVAGVASPPSSLRSKALWLRFPCLPRRVRPIPTLTLLAVIGCATGATFKKDGFVIQENLWRDDETSIKARAAFDLSCPAESLTLQVLTLVPRSYFAAQVGVTGCERKAVYVRPENRYDAPWIMNSAAQAPGN